MSYEANYHTAMTYLDAGLTDRAIEFLEKALSEISEQEKTADNAVYFTILVKLAKHQLLNSRHIASLELITEGLDRNAQHPDLLFLNALCAMDLKEYDTALASLVSYLVIVQQPQGREALEFSNDNAIDEVLEQLLPDACRNSATFEQSAVVIRKLAKVSKSDLLTRACDILDTVEKERAQTANA